MSDVTKENWDSYVSENLECPDPIGYLEATKDMVTTMKKFLENTESGDDLKAIMSKYLMERQDFINFGHKYMESGQFLTHVSPQDRAHYSLPWNLHKS
ncbi:hypothetical protein GCM10028807_59910 [Spirosoma daeguense]